MTNDDRARHRRVYAKGYYDGYDAARIGMTPARAEAKVRELTGVVRKVYDAVPIRDQWTAVEIGQAIQRATRSTMDQRVMKGCLDTLKGHGLITEPERGKFRRVEVRAKMESIVEKAAQTVVPIKPATEAAPATQEKAMRPTEILAPLAKRIDAAGNLLKELASDIEAAAIEIEDNAAAESSEMVRLRMLRDALKGLV